MKHVRVYNLKEPGSRCVGAIATSMILMVANCLSGPAALAQQAAVVETVNDFLTDDESIASWISDLISDDFGTRELARSRLLRAGADAMPQLEKHLEATNSELRLSVSRLHETIADEIAANQIQSFLDCKVTLAGWQIFQKHFGDTPENRHLYAEVFRTDRNLLEQLDSVDVTSVDLLDRLIRGQRSELAHSSQPNSRHLPVLAAVVSEVFSMTHQAKQTALRQTPLQVQISLAQLVSEPGFHRWINQGQSASELVRHSLVDWVTATTDGPILMSAKINVASLLEIGESIPLCLQCLDSRDVPAANRRMAMELIVRFGDQSHFAALERQIDDPLIVFREAPDPIDLATTSVNTCQMGDIALASLVLIAGEELHRFGFANAKTKSGKTLPRPDNLVFPDEDARRNARQQWREYRAANLQ